MAIFNISVDSNENDALEHVNALVSARSMRIAINSYYSEVLRNYHKYIELTPDQTKLLDEITDKLREHFKEFFTE